MKIVLERGGMIEDGDQILLEQQDSGILVAERDKVERSEIGKALFFYPWHTIRYIEY